MSKNLMSPAYRVINFIDSDDGEPYTKMILNRYDEEVHKELERHAEENIPDHLTQHFIMVAASNRDQLEEFLNLSAHGPH
jgi:hypothetical protein